MSTNAIPPGGTPDNALQDSHYGRHSKVLLLVALGSLVALAASLLMPGVLGRLVNTREFLPHGFCYLWNSKLVWLHLVSDASIALSYIAISLALLYLVRRARRDIPFQWMFVAFGVFIVACGGTHIMEVITLWAPVYWLSGEVKAITAVASVLTAVLFPPLIPRILAMISEAKVSEERGKRLEQAHRELETVYARLKAMDELRTRFFANVSHELRTPLTLILAPAEKLLSSPGLSEEQRRTLQIIQNNARSLLHRVNDLLDVAKLEAGHMEVHYEQTDLAHLLRLTAGSLKGLAEERGIQLREEAPFSLEAQVDTDKVQRILLNLLSNALKFTPQLGSIVASVREFGGRAVIEVRDSGPGVPAEMRQKVFERFEQVDSSDTRRMGGTGLGLAIVKEFAELHGGRVWVTDAVEGGALFAVELPLQAPAGTVVSARAGRGAVVPVPPSSVLANPSAAGSPADSRLSGLAQADSTSDRPATVLVVEDNPDMSTFIRDTLAENYRVFTAADGSEGLTRSLELQPDLIVADLMMPYVGGEQLLRQLRQEPKTAEIPVLILTARTEEQLRARLLREGAQDFLVKPFSIDELRARVKNLVAMKQLRDILKAEVVSQERDVIALIRELLAKNKALEAALETQRDEGRS